MPHKVLVIGPAWVGDTVMMQCLLKLIKQRDPSAVIDVLAPAWTFSLLSRMPEVNLAIALPLTHGDLKLKLRYQLGKRLKKQGYQQAIVLPNSFKSALIPWFAGIPIRTGWVGEMRYGLLNDIRCLDKKRYPLMADQYRALALPKNEALPERLLPQLTIDPVLQQAALLKHQLPWHDKPVLALCPGAAYGSSKCWPANYYAQIANEKIDQGWDVWLFGSEQDKPITQKITELTDGCAMNLAGRLELAETIDLMSLVSGVISNDSGLMHVAAALNKPVIALYGSTSPDFTPPLSKEAHILTLHLDCQPCFKRVCPLGHHRCMQDLLPAQVSAAMAGWGSNHARTLD